MLVPDGVLPPQCEGPDISGWDWSTVEHESAHGTTWGTYDVVGTYDGVFTLTEAPATPSPLPQSEPDPVSPCPEPPGGWEIPDRSKASPDDTERAISAARKVERHAGGWIGCSTNHTERELNRIADQISGMPAVTSVGTDTRRSKVTVGAWVATESLWRQLAEKYGADVIDLHGSLEPIDERPHDHK